MTTWIPLVERQHRPYIHLHVERTRQKFTTGELEAWMTLSLADVLPLLQSGKFRKCEYYVGSAFFVDDEENWAKLDLDFAESVRVMTAAYGDPEQEEYVYPGEDVSRLACWKIPGGFVYVMLSYQDNTRIRTLTLGMCDTGRLQVKKPAIW